MEDLKNIPIKRTFGYARVSTKEQKVDNQILKLLEMGVDKDRIYSDVISGKKYNREGLNKLFEIVEEGDHILVTKLDRLGRTLLNTLQLVEKLAEKKVSICFINDNINTRDKTGDNFIPIYGAIAQIERNHIVERTKEGIARAKLNPDIKFGPPEKINYDVFMDLYKLGYNQAKIAKAMNVTRQAINAFMKKHNI